MQVVKVCMRDQYEIDGRQVADADTGLSQSLQNEEPSRKIRIDQYVFTTHLDKEAGVADKGQAQLTIADQFWLVNFTGAGSDGGMSDEAGELAGTPAQRSILDGGLKHRLGES